MENHDPKTDGQHRNPELPGDTNSADIVGRTGEEMPLQSHDGLEAEERPRGARAARDDADPVRTDDDNPRGRVAD